MALPTYASKRFYKCGAKQTTWPTEVALGAGDEMLVTSDGDPELKQDYKSYIAIGRVMPTGGRLGAKDAIDFAPEFDMNYLPGAIGSLIGGLFGETGLPDPLFVVDATNNKVDFDEGAGELTGTVASGSYNATTLCAAIKAALDDAGALTYTVTFDAVTKKFTISAATEFALHWSTGTNKLVDISTMCGYSDAADDTGAATYTADTVAVGSAYVHTFEWADEASPAFTFATMRPGAIWAVPAAIPTKLAFSIGDGLLRGAITLRGNNLIADSTTNEEAEMEALTPEAEADLGFVNFQEGVLRMNAQAGDALDDGDIVETSDFGADFERITDAKQVMGGSQIAKPVEGNFNIGLKLRFPRADAANTAYLADFIAISAMKLTAVFTGNIIVGTHAHGLAIYFPRLKFKAPPEVKLADIMDAGAEFIAEEAAAAPSGMSYVRPYITITNTRAAAYTT
ncbi:MAG TPA: hypothetical protein VMY39_05415 [Planctomycetota bacterium]|nr:hypothetical protein [Planctomycetota bacterium]